MGTLLVMAIAATAACLAVGGVTPRLMPAAFGAPKLHFAALYAVGVWSWTCGLIGLGLRFLAGASPTRRYLADASYWIYLAHLPLLLGLQLLMRGWLLPWPLKFVLLLGVTMLLLLLSYHWLVRSTFVGALLNGRRYPRAWPTTPTTRTPLMRALALLALLPAALGAQGPVPPAAMPLATLLARYATASGSLEKVQNRRVAMKVTGILPEAIPVVSEAMRPNLLRKDVTLAGAVQITATDGTKPWRVDPFASRDGKATDVPAAELADFLEETDFDGPLIGAAAKHVVLEYAGPKVVQVRGTATPVHAVNVRWPNGRTATVHLDARSYLEVLRTQRRPVMGRDASMSITSSDYRVVQGSRCRT
ncbi:MAG: acyltransferase family protein [Gemmatimonadetes bacterium]|nr:acyltransferase family protein [Gemmatimonadota bacterium]